MCLYNYTGTPTGPDRISTDTSSQSTISAMDVDSIMRAFIGMHQCVSLQDILQACQPTSHEISSGTMHLHMMCGAQHDTETCGTIYACMNC